MTPFLGVSTSITGRRWVGLSEADDRFAQSIAQHTNLPITLSRTLARLQVNPSDALAYLSPSLRDLMPDPSIFRDMEKAAQRITSAIIKRETIAIFADYDVDGGSCAALLIDFFRHFELSATLYIPDRIDEGYGPNEPAMVNLAAHHDLIICVDCGTLSHDAIAAAKNAEVIVLDHHVGGETLPPALAIVNPNRQDEDTMFGNLCAAGVVFLTLVAVNRILRSKEITTPDLMAMLDLVALATVADVAPLTGLNRALVRQGLTVMARRNRVGIAALSDVARLTSAPDSYHLSFALAPRINAGGRIGKADLGARLLAATDPDEAAAMADQLSQLNSDRREIEAQVSLKAMEQAEERGFDAPLVWAAGKGWHSGVVGIVASRLKEASNRPSIVIGLEDGKGKGSGRSVTGIDLGSAIATCTHEGLLLKGGGHKMAAGLTLSEDKLQPAMERLAELLQKQGADNIGPKDLCLDGSIMPAAITTELIEQLELAGPYGAGAPAPRFALPAQKITFAKRAGENHLRLTAKDANGGRIDSICFGAYDGPIGPTLENHKGQSFHLAGRLEIDEWGGRRKDKLRLEDAAVAD